MSLSPNTYLAFSYFKQLTHSQIYGIFFPHPEYTVLCKVSFHDDIYRMSPIYLNLTEKETKLDLSKDHATTGPIWDVTQSLSQSSRRLERSEIMHPLHYHMPLSRNCAWSIMGFITGVKPRSMGFTLPLAWSVRPGTKFAHHFWTRSPLTCVCFKWCARAE